jgi:signal transduction histidine kinase
MKLINRTLLFLSAILLVTVSFWAVFFYYQLVTQIKTTVDEGLANYKIVLIDKLKDDSLIIQQNIFAENIYIIRSVKENYALQVKDSYKDTTVFSGVKNKNYQTRLLTTAFIAADGKYYEMKVISQELDNGKLIKKLAISLLWLFLFLFVSTILFNNFVLRKTWKPFYKLLKYLNDFQLDKGSLIEPSDTKIKEFSILNKSILKLLKTNVNIFNSQKQFIENAAHELQTPLAIGINKLELLAGAKDLPPEHIQKIGNIIETFQRLSGLNKSLLLLTRIENKQFVFEEQINFDELFVRLIRDFSDYAEYRKIEIKYINEGPWLFQMNKDLAEFLSMNLVKNAIIYNRIGGELVIKLSSSYFIIENTSDEPEMPADKLFVRFNRNPKSKNSTGLGLAIVKAIADVSELSVNYSYNGRHIIKVSSSKL